MLQPDNILSDELEKYVGYATYPLCIQVFCSAPAYKIIKAIWAA
jgi:hypothetical protein